MIMKALLMRNKSLCWACDREDKENKRAKIQGFTVL